MIYNVNLKICIILLKFLIQIKYCICCDMYFKEFLISAYNAINNTLIHLLLA